LPFFRWTINNDIIKYTSDNYRTIIDKYIHVNSYFKKNLIENTSFSTSDENTDLTKSDGDNDIQTSVTKNTEKIPVVTSKYKSPVISRNIFLEF
jgi:glutamate/tyrosine decarboxylase-like PLP-dependent enzyme